MIGIYCIENKKNNKKYIGQSLNIQSRKKDHFFALKNNIHHNHYLQNAWNKNKEENFAFYTIQECKEEELDFFENYWISHFNTYERKNGYNLKEAGVHGRHSLESKKKMSLIKTGELNPNYGKTRNEEQLKSMRLSQLGSKKSNSSSKYRGVHFSKTQSKWMASLRINNGINKKTKYIGIFSSEKEAALAFNKYVVENNLSNPLNIIARKG